MADAQARKAAIKKASSQVRANSVFVRRAMAGGALQSSKTTKITVRKAR
jgi:hypothetical protein